MWFSRKREYRADDAGARLAGTTAMISALQRLRSEQGVPVQMPDSLTAFGINGGLKHGLAGLFMSHPAAGRPHRRSALVAVDPGSALKERASESPFFLLDYCGVHSALCRKFTPAVDLFGNPAIDIDPMWERAAAMRPLQPPQIYQWKPDTPVLKPRDPGLRNFPLWLRTS
jgi:hypothetical protein